MMLFTPLPYNKNKIKPPPTSPTLAKTHFTPSTQPTMNRDIPPLPKLLLPLTKQNKPASYSNRTSASTIMVPHRSLVGIHPARRTPTPSVQPQCRNSRDPPKFVTWSGMGLFERTAHIVSTNRNEKADVDSQGGEIRHSREAKQLVSPGTLERDMVNLVDGTEFEGFEVWCSCTKPCC